MGLIHTKVSSPREEAGERTEGKGLRNTCISRTKREEESEIEKAEPPKKRIQERAGEHMG